MYEGRIEENFCGAWSYCGYPAITIFAVKIYRAAQPKIRDGILETADASGRR